jgi:hypothetical protein
MPVSDYFAGSYDEARNKFLASARSAGARISSYPHPDRRGPAKEELAIDVAILGPVEAEIALLMISGTHGVEGFCGSGCQVGYLTDRLHEALPAGVKSILVHALNPHGFAWRRRVNEDNVDLNRNFQDFSKPLPDSSAYEELHDILVPEEWEGPIREKSDAALMHYIQSRGQAVFQAAVTGGQYTRPTGLFFGGVRDTWSNRTLRQILPGILVAVKRIAVLDLHTGLGPTGYGEPIHVGSEDDGLHRAQKWYGCEVTSTNKGTSVSAAVTGSLPGVFLDFPGVEVTFVALEFGTRPIMEVLAALRADHWLHAVENRQTELRDQIRSKIKDAFFVDSPAWKAAVYVRTAEFALRAGRGLTAG